MLKTTSILTSLLLGSTLLLAPQVAEANQKTTLNYIADDLYVDYDSDELHWAYDQIDQFMAADIIEGNVYYEDDIPYVFVRPNDSITRAEFTKILVNALNLEKTGSTTAFKDVTGNKWFNSFVEIASSNGIVTGYNDGSFRPDAQITRGEMAAMIKRAYEDTVVFPETASSSFPDVKAPYWATDYVNQVASVKIINGYKDNSFRPQRSATRAEAIVMMSRGLDLQVNNLPTAEELEMLVKTYLTQDIAGSTTLDFPGLEANTKKYTTGYLLVSALENLELVKEIIADGGSFSFEQVTEPTFKATKIATNFAEVEVKNNKLKVTLAVDEDNSFTTTDNFDGIWNLKKMPNGEWKIYNNQYDMFDL